MKTRKILPRIFLGLFDRLQLHCPRSRNDLILEQVFTMALRHLEGERFRTLENPKG